MTIEEKVAQLGSAWVFELASHGHLDPERATAVLADGLGQVTRISGASSLAADAGRGLANEIQRHLVEHTRLGIPAIVHEEICAGLIAREATVFPQAIGVAATFRPEHNQRDHRRHPPPDAGDRRPSRPVAGARRLPRPALGPPRGDVRRGSRTSSARWASPSSAACRATTSRDGVVATAKHFVGYGASEGGLNWAPAHLPERELRDVYLRPFEAAVRDAGLRIGDERLPRARRGAVRRQPLAAHRAAARRVGLRRHRRVRLLLGAPARGVPPRRHRRRRRRGDRAARRARRRAARAPTATPGRCATPWRAARRRSPTSTRRCAAC